ncbi:MAG: hypothetical protein LBN26_07715 [Christensenellaceae bacterium]|nr:hypothetical protein [Christensenellaceae bacterium]
MGNSFLGFLGIFEIILYGGCTNEEVFGDIAGLHYGAKLSEYSFGFG